MNVAISMLNAQRTLGSIGDRFKRSWSITKKTFHVMGHDKEIMLFPILSVIFSIILFIILVFPFTVSLFFAGRSPAEPFLLYLGIFSFSII